MRIDPPASPASRAVRALLLLATLAPLRATPDPYLNLRDGELGYHGASEDLENLTELRIGWFGPSDPDDPLAGDLWFAASLAIADANAPRSGGAAPAHGIENPSSDLPLRLIPRWSSDPWGTGVSQLTRMVYDEQPLALLGSIDSASTHLAEQVVAKAQLPLISPVATDASLTLAGVSWMFSCAPSDDSIAHTLVDSILDAEADTPSENSSFAARHASLVLLSTTDHESRMTTRAVMRECTRRGQLPALRLEIEPGTTDFTAHMRAAAAARPTAVAVIAGADDAAHIVRALRSTLDRVAIFGGPSLGRSRFHAVAGTAAEGVRFPLLFAPVENDAVAADFVARFTTARGRAPDYAAALTFDATRMLATAIRRAGPNRARVREALIALSPWEGIAGPIDFDGTGQNRRAPLALGTIRAGEVIRIHRPVTAGDATSGFGVPEAALPARQPQPPPRPTSP